MEVISNKPNVQDRRSQPRNATLRGRRVKDSLAALMKLLWYWYVIRGAGSILETHRRDASKKASNGEEFRFRSLYTSLVADPRTVRAGLFHLCAREFLYLVKTNH